MKSLFFIFFISLTASSLSFLGDDIAKCAIEQLGKPYQMGGLGPYSFDDFGLVFYCMQTVNNIPCSIDRIRQANQGIRVNELYPGDVLYTYDKWHNLIGAIIYIGNSEVIYTTGYLNKGVIKSTLSNLNWENHYDYRRNW